MADSKISNLSAITALAGTDELAVASSGASKKITGANLFAALASARAKITGGNYTTTSASFVDVDGTNLSLTITTGARRVLVVVTGAAGLNVGTNQDIFMDVMIDGTREGGSDGLVSIGCPNTTINPSASWSYVTDVLSAGSHTFNLEWAVSGGTGLLFASSAFPLVFAVVEMAG